MTTNKSLLFVPIAYENRPTEPKWQVGLFFLFTPEGHIAPEGHIVLKAYRVRSAYRSS